MSNSSKENEVLLPEKEEMDAGYQNKQDKKKKKSIYILSRQYLSKCAHTFCLINLKLRTWVYRKKLHKGHSF